VHARSSEGAERVVPLRHPGRWIAALLIVIALVAATRSAVANSAFEWGTVGHYLFSRTVLDGLVLTLELTALAMVIGVVGGVVLAVMRLSPNPLISGASWVYIWFFRGTPVLLQIYFWFYLSSLYPTISFGIPFGPTFFHASANSLITKLAAGALALGLNEAAYMGEIVRAGILSVDRGQTEAASSLGLTSMTTMRRIVLPQAMRVIIPPLGNETISMLKTTSLVSVIALADLLDTVQQIYTANFKIIPLLVVAALLYLMVTSVLYVGQFFLERRFARGTVARTSALQQLWRAVRIGHSPIPPGLLSAERRR
jgi:polar amino acid transport system permease protein